MPTVSAGLAPVPSAAPTVPVATALIAAAQALLPMLARGQAVDPRALREAMTSAFGGSDAEGLWAWKDAYEACEVAQLLFLRRFGPAMRARSAPAKLAMLGKVAALLPTHTRRSEESQALQQFSTPIPLGFVAATAAAITADDVVLEPSAGTGLLAVFAELASVAGMGSLPRSGQGMPAQRHRSCSTNWAEPAPTCSRPSFRPAPSHASTRPTSTTTSIRSCGRASC